MARTTHDRTRDHRGVDKATNIQLDGSTTNYSDLDVLQAVIADIDDRVDAAGSSGGGGLTDLITGNDQHFDSSLGAWTNTGGTMTRDTSWKMDGKTASLKYVMTASGQHADLAIAGTFKADTDYWFVFWLSNEDTPGTESIDLTVGLIGTDQSALTIALNITADDRPYNSGGNFIPCAVRWRPSADRTGVSARIGYTPSTSGSTWNLGHIRAWETPFLGPVTVGSYSYTPLNYLGLATVISPYPATYYGLNMSASGDMWLYAYGAFSGISLDRGPSASMWLYAEHDVADKPQEGVNIEVGTDYLGFFIGQKDSNTVQFYGDWDDYNFEFEDGGTNGWGSRSGTGVLKRFSTMENRTASGTATITSGNTSIVVTHGAGYTPTVNDLVITPTNNPTNDPGNFWISSVGATQFTINVRNNPGASGASFAWRVDR